jgi:hypothetical protein
MREEGAEEGRGRGPGIELRVPGVHRDRPLIRRQLVARRARPSALFLYGPMRSKAKKNRPPNIGGPHASRE